MRLRTIAALLTILTITPAFAATQHAAIPRLTIADGDDGTVPLRLESIEIHILLRGHLARTTYELAYRNGTNRELDGDFAFPLPPDAEISDLGLYFGGRLRHAVPVERVMARSIYEKTVHRRVDPALAEWSASSRAFHFRVYPIPANGLKVVHIAYDQELTTNPYDLDLRYGATLANVELTIESDSRIDAEDVPLARSGDRWSMRRTQYQLNGVIRAVQDKRETAIAARSADGNWYASAAVNVHSTARPAEPATHMTILYDASASAVQRDDAKVREYLRQLLSRQKVTSISVVPFHLSVDAVVQSDVDNLDQTLAAIPAAGATNLASLLDQLPAIAASQPAGSRIVLISDGINSIGDSARLARAVQQAAKMHRSLTIINASPSADDRFLGGLARATGGWYLDLTQTDPAAAAEASMRQPELLMVQMLMPPIRDVLPSSVLTTSDASITVSARSRDAIVAFPVMTGNARHEIPVEVLESEEGSDLVRRAWARARLRELIDSGATPEEVIEHGRTFSQLTPRTSLLVLERWQDYESNGLPLPADLREQKEADEKAYREQQAAAERSRRAANEAARVPQHQAVRVANQSSLSDHAPWFMTGQVVQDGTAIPGATVTLILAAGETLVQVTDANGRFRFDTSTPPVSATLRAELSGFYASVRVLYRPARGTQVVMSLAVAMAETITVTASAPELLRVASVASNVSSSDRSGLADQLLDPVRTTELSQSDVLAQKTAAERLDIVAGVLAKLKTLNSPADRFRYYLASRAILGGEKLFQAEAAVAMRDVSPELAIRILTDLIEANPDDAAMMRIIGRVLSGWGRDDLSRLIFERALEISPRETQTWRELFLLDIREGKDLSDRQKRYGSYARDERMQQTDDALQLELQRRGAGVDPRIDPNAELQIETMWDSNYTDIDLHVVEPGGEEVFYQHQRSANNGVLHADVVTGFGPETYTLPRMANGAYQIALVYYSGDDTRMTLETLVHVIIYIRGQRHDHFTVLTGKEDRRVVATVP
jgi:Ca-activated chloride channel homolog